MKRRTLLAIIIPSVLIGALILYSVLSGKEKDVVLETAVRQGPFEISVMVTGELQAIRETEIQGPSLLRSRELRLREILIQDLIPEGTMVDSGDWVATLDRSEADNSLKDIMDQLEQEESEYLRVRLDTTMTLRQLRDDLINLEFAMEEAEITLEQSKFEPPATIRQAEIELEKATRAFDQARKNYSLRVQQARAEMREAEINLERRRRTRQEMETVLQRFDIMAPASGMVIYKKNWDGTKRTVGSEINPWDLAVATLPDMSTMISETYVNEIDVSKIKARQQVRIGVDAFPEKKFTGEVLQVANIGQQLPNTDAKVFEVRIELNEIDSILRPSMTTSNQIVTEVLQDVLYIPLEAAHANDSATFVYSMDGKKRVVLLGKSNENHIVVEKGLERGDRIFLSLPPEPETFEYTNLALIDEIRQRKEEEVKRQEEQQQKRPQRQQRPDMRQFQQGMQSPAGARPGNVQPSGAQSGSAATSEGAASTVQRQQGGEGASVTSGEKPEGGASTGQRPEGNRRQRPQGDRGQGQAAVDT
ncbi:MAG: HlyD family efflux transporter periplasmic adaptor subunit, partial [Bacteroidetes bacterium]